MTAEPKDEKKDVVKIINLENEASKVLPPGADVVQFNARQLFRGMYNLSKVSGYETLSIIPLARAFLEGGKVALKGDSVKTVFAPFNASAWDDKNIRFDVVLVPVKGKQGRKITASEFCEYVKTLLDVNTAIEKTNKMILGETESSGAGNTEYTAEYTPE